MRFPYLKDSYIEVSKMGGVPFSGLFCGGDYDVLGSTLRSPP